MEDALELGRAIAQHGPTPEALRAYESVRCRIHPSAPSMSTCLQPEKLQGDSTACHAMNPAPETCSKMLQAIWAVPESCVLAKQGTSCRRSAEGVGGSGEELGQAGGEVGAGGAARIGALLLAHL